VKSLEQIRQEFAASDRHSRERRAVRHSARPPLSWVLAAVIIIGVTIVAVLRVKGLI
jgi:hypothetical protein